MQNRARELRHRIAGKLRRRIFVVIDFKSKWVEMKLRKMFKSKCMRMRLAWPCIVVGSRQHHKSTLLQCEMNAEKWRNKGKKLEWIAFHYLIVRSFFPPSDFAHTNEFCSVYATLYGTCLSTPNNYIIFLPITVYFRRARTMCALRTYQLQTDYTNY